MFAGVLKTTAGTSFRSTHWICGVCGEENSIRRNVCNSPYCKGVRLRDSVPGTRLLSRGAARPRGRKRELLPRVLQALRRDLHLEDQSQPTRSPPILPVKAVLPGASRSPFTKSPRARVRARPRRKQSPLPLGLRGQGRKSRNTATPKKAFQPASSPTESC